LESKIIEVREKERTIEAEKMQNKEKQGTLTLRERQYDKTRMEVA
jgi:hypothetical protein